MSAFGDDFAAAALPGILAVHGDVVTYTTRAGVETSVTVAPGGEGLIEEQYANGTRTLRSRKVMLGRDPTAADGGVANPKVHDTVTINGEVWNVQTVLPEKQTDVVSILEVTRNAGAERAHQSFRR